MNNVLNFPGKLVNRPSTEDIVDDTLDKVVLETIDVLRDNGVEFAKSKELLISNLPLFALFVETIKAIICADKELPHHLHEVANNLFIVEIDSNDDISCKLKNKEGDDNDNN